MSTKNRWLLSLKLVIGTAFLMQWQGRDLKTLVTPLGIFNLELASTPELFQHIMSTWNSSTV